MDERTQKYAETLAALIRCETISVDPDADRSKFYAMQNLLREAFPHIFGAGELEDFGGSFLLRWPGRSSGKEPIMLMNHHDVVEAPGSWKYPPFSGEIAEGKVWGRGTLDTKGGLWAMLTAADELAAEGFVPDCDVYFESSCTEEIGGQDCDRISQILQDRGMHFAMCLDEGGTVRRDPIGCADGIFAMVGVGEKGCAVLKFIARSNGGHASTPGPNTALVRLARFIVEMEDCDLFKPELTPLIAEMLRRMSPYMEGELAKMAAEPEKYKAELEAVIPTVSPMANALMRSTLAFTMSCGSDGSNVLPQEAWVVGNLRFRQDQGGPACIAAITEIAEKYDLEVEILDPGFYTPMSDYQSPAFQLVERAIRTYFPDVTVAPYFMTGASDCSFMARVCDNCLRFAPFIVSEEQHKSIHALNECIDLSALAPAVDFFKFVIREA